MDLVKMELNAFHFNRDATDATVHRVGLDSDARPTLTIVQKNHVFLEQTVRILSTISTVIVHLDSEESGVTKRLTSAPANLAVQMEYVLIDSSATNAFVTQDGREPTVRSTLMIVPHLHVKTTANALTSWTDIGVSATPASQVADASIQLTTVPQRTPVKMEGLASICDQKDLCVSADQDLWVFSAKPRWMTAFPAPAQLSAPQTVLTKTMDTSVNVIQDSLVKHVKSMWTNVNQTHVSMVAHAMTE